MARLRKNDRRARIPLRCGKRWPAITCRHALAHQSGILTFHSFSHGRQQHDNIGQCKAARSRPWWRRVLSEKEKAAFAAPSSRREICRDLETDSSRVLSIFTSKEQTLDNIGRLLYKYSKRYITLFDRSANSVGIELPVLARCWRDNETERQVDSGNMFTIG
jgi:hypothetical protein